MTDTHNLASGEAGTPADAGKPTVVGIGTSAGGLRALKTFFSNVPEKNGVAWVVVVHLSPEHESHLADLLQPHVRMPVRQVRDTIPLEPGQVYVIPPGSNLSAVDSHLRLSESAAFGRAPIDHFFRTLAATHDGHSVGVILTGTGSDGALGVKAIKERNGLVLVQDPSEAEFDGMPQSAIATGVVDRVLRLEQIPAAVLGFDRTRPNVTIPTEEQEEKGQVDVEERQLLQKIFAQVRARTNRDFSRYKQSTLLRRIERRMQMREVTEPTAYLELLREDPDEVRALGDDILITVTNFFRDPDIWDRLAKEVVPALFDRKGQGESVRVWSVGCATGEEAYSLTMLLLEEAARRDLPAQVQVFASDLHERSLERAREGFYPGDIETDVNPERLSRFFQREDGGYRIRKEVREKVVFAPHNLLGDPPFSRIDLISCRNVLIYLQRDVQQEILELFHYSLGVEGVLVLGTAETVEASELFRTESKLHHIYRKRAAKTTEPRLPVFPTIRSRFPTPQRREEAAAAAVGYGALHHRLVEGYAPPSMLVSPDGRVVHLSEHAGRYLVHPGGEPTTNAFKVVREELRVELRGALHRARHESKPTRFGPVEVRFEGGEMGWVVVDVRPAEGAEQDGFALVLFEERAPAEVAAATLAQAQSPDEEGQLRSIRGELEQTRQRLQAIIEEYETTQEEMRASHEELQSANEELRSTLEELETSKEELQSMNEELQTVNQENRHKVAELSQLSTDLQNLLTSTDIATLFLDRDLRILRFTPNVGDLFNIRPVDRGRPLTDLTNRLGYQEVTEDAISVLRTLVPVQREVGDHQGRWYLARVLPYRSAEDRIDGVVITFVDISERKHAEMVVRRSEERLRRMMNIPAVGILIFSTDGTLLDTNDAFLGMTGYTRTQVESGTLHWDILTPSEHSQLTRQQLALIAETGQSGPYEKEYLTRDGSRSWMLFAGSALGDGTLVEFCIDISDRKRAEAALKESESRFRDLMTTSSYAVYTMSPDWSEMWQLEGGGFVADTAIPSTNWLAEYIPTYAQPMVTKAIEQAVRTRSMFDLEHPVTRADGTVGWTHSRAVPRLDENGEIREWFGAASDVSARKAAEEALRQSEERYRNLFNSIDQGFCIIEVLFDEADRPVDYLFVDANPAFTRLSGIEDPWGRTMREIAPAHEEYWFESYGRIAQTGVPERFSNRARQLGDRMYEVYAFRVGEPEECKVAVLFDDVTIRLRSEEALRQFNETLERRVVERTTELTTAIEGRRQVLQQLVTAEEDERRRISRELHDQMGQQLTGLLLGLRAVHREAGDPGLAERIRDLELLATEIGRDMQNMAVELRPPALDTFGLPAALQNHLEEWSRRYGIEHDISARALAGVRLSPEIETTLYRIAQEALTNVLRHAGASRVSLLLELKKGEVRLIVEDDGAGFDVEETLATPEKARRIGVRGMRERVALLGGTMEIESAPGSGTTIFVRVPEVLGTLGEISEEAE